MILDDLEAAEAAEWAAVKMMTETEQLQLACQHEMLGLLAGSDVDQWAAIRERNMMVQTILQAKWRRANLEWQRARSQVRKLSAEFEREVLGDGVQS